MSAGRPTAANQSSPLHPEREPPSILTLILTQKVTCKEFILFELWLRSDSISCVRGVIGLISKSGHELCPYFTCLKSVVLTTFVLTPVFRGTARG